MPQALTDFQKMNLETLVDNHSLANVLDALAEMCDEKAAHVAANWQDKKLAATWTRMGKGLGSAALAAETHSL